MFIVCGVLVINMASFAWMAIIALRLANKAEDKKGRALQNYAASFFSMLSIINLSGMASLLFR